MNSEEMIIGANEISKYVFGHDRDIQHTYYLIRKGRIVGRKIGQTVYALKSDLDAFRAAV